MNTWNQNIHTHRKQREKYGDYNVNTQHQDKDEQYCDPQAVTRYQLWQTNDQPSIKIKNKSIIYNIYIDYNIYILIRT